MGERSLLLNLLAPDQHILFQNYVKSHPHYDKAVAGKCWCQLLVFENVVVEDAVGVVGIVDNRCFDSILNYCFEVVLKKVGIVQNLPGVKQHENCYLMEMDCVAAESDFGRM